MPLSAMVARAEVMSWPPGAHASTYGGNPVAVAASLATIELLERELIANSARVGGYILDRLRTWPDRFKNVGDVRGLGLMIGIELVLDRQSKKPDADLAARVQARMLADGFLIGVGGHHGNVLRLQPPLVIADEDLDELRPRSVEIFQQLFRQ